MEENFNKHLGNKLKLRRLALGLTQTKVAKAINVTFQQIQKYEKGTNGVSSIRLLQLSNYLKVPINYFFEDFSEYAINADKIKEKGIENIFCISVNDPYVMNAWGDVNNTEDKIQMLSDPYLLFTKAIGAEVDRNSKGMGIRSNRYVVVIENLEVLKIQVEKETKQCGLTSAESILEIL